MKDKSQLTNLFFSYFPYLLFFLFAVVYFGKFVNYIFFYQEKSVLFQTTFSFFAEKVNHPGGFLVYLGELQTAFYYYPLTGAILVALEIIAIIFLISAIGKTISGEHAFWWPFLLGGGLLLLQANYQFWSFNSLGIVFQLLFFFITVRFLRGNLQWISVLLFPLNYFLFGSFSQLFLVMFVLFQVLEKEKYWMLKIVGIIIFATTFFFVGKEFLFYRTTKDLLVFPYSSTKIGEQSFSFFSIVILLSFLPVLFFIAGKFNGKRISALKFVPFVLVFVTAVLSIKKIDKKNSDYFYVEKLFYQKKYNDVIAFNSEFLSTNQLTNYLNNIALAETGQLDDLFFSFPQSLDGGTLFLKWDLAAEVLKRGGYFYYSLGMINEAQRWAYEFMVMHGETPEGLKMLIKTELINGNYKVAQKYIFILKNTFFYREQAEGFEELLFNDEAVKKDAELGAKKRLRTRQDFFVLSDEPQKNLDLALAAESTNYIALEYKLALLMLQKDMKGIVKLLPDLEDGGFERIPINVEEAVVAFQQLRVGEMPELKRLKINPYTEQQFRQYYQIFQKNSSDKSLAQHALAQQFSHTFWYYVFFN